MALSSDYVITALTGKQGIQGDKGDKGATGASGKSVIAQYSVDGSSSWHSTYTSGDIYMRTSTDSGATWSSAMRIVGEKGATGAKGDKGDKGDKGATGAKGLDGIVLKCNVGSLNYTLQRNKKANYEAQSFTLALYQGSTVLTPSSSTITTSNVKNLTVSKSGTSTITITATSAYNGAIPSGYIIATLVYNNVSYSMNIPITTNYNGKYLGLLSALPSSANLGDYFVASKTFSASSTTYTQSFVYERVCSSSNTYAWIVSTEINSVEVFSDILSLVNASSNSQAVAIVQRLVASDIFVNNLSAQKILFQHFVASSSINNKAKVGDQIISMGYNPKDSSDTDFSFMIQKCIQEANSSTGQEEVWMKHFWTKFLASGLLTLNLSGCLQTTGDVKTNPASVWTKFATFHNSITATWAGEINGKEKIYVGLSCGDIYSTSNGKTWTQEFESENSESPARFETSVVAFCKYNNKLYSCVGGSLFNLRCSDNWNTSLGTFNYAPQSMVVYNNKLYIGTSNTYYYTYDGTFICSDKKTSKMQFFVVFKNELYVLATAYSSFYKINASGNPIEISTQLTTYLQNPTASNNYIVAVTGPSSDLRGRIYYSLDGINWKYTYPKLKDGSQCTSSYNNFFYKEGLFIFPCAVDGNACGDIFVTTDFENWLHIENSADYAWNTVCYSNLTNSFLLGGVDTIADTNTDGKGQLWKADYTSLSSLAEISQAPYITSYNLAETGYVKWSNGLLIQWGKSSYANDTSSYKYKTITMPLAYKSSTAYQVIMNGYPAGSGPNYCCAPDNSKDAGTSWTSQRFGYLCIYASTPRWIAIGEA